MKLLFIDTETTGTEPGVHGVVQIAGIIEIDGKVVEEFDLRCRPFQGQIMAAKALEVIGKSADEVLAYPDPKETYRKLVSIFQKHIDRYNKNDKFHMVGQNTKFDYDMLTAWFNKNGDKFFYAYVAYHLIDLIQATALFTVAGKMKLPNMKLATVAEAFGIQFDAHDALEDIRTTREIFYRFVTILKGCRMPWEPDPIAEALNSGDGVYRP